MFINSVQDLDLILKSLNFDFLFPEERALVVERLRDVARSVSGQRRCYCGTFLAHRQSFDKHNKVCPYKGNNPLTSGLSSTSSTASLLHTLPPVSTHSPMLTSGGFSLPPMFPRSPMLTSGLVSSPLPLTNWPMLTSGLVSSPLPLTNWPMLTSGGHSLPPILAPSPQSTSGSVSSSSSTPASPPQSTSGSASPPSSPKPKKRYFCKFCRETLIWDHKADHVKTAKHQFYLEQEVLRALPRSSDDFFHEELLDLMIRSAISFNAYDKFTSFLQRNCFRKVLKSKAMMSKLDKVVKANRETFVGSFKNHTNITLGIDETSGKLLRMYLSISRNRNFCFCAYVHA